jgi:hypothetical protein
MPLKLCIGTVPSAQVFPSQGHFSAQFHNDNQNLVIDSL